MTVIAFDKQVAAAIDFGADDPEITMFEIREDGSFKIFHPLQGDEEVHGSRGEVNMNIEENDQQNNEQTDAPGSSSGAEKFEEVRDEARGSALEDEGASPGEAAGNVAEGAETAAEAAQDAESDGDDGQTGNVSPPETKPGDGESADEGSESQGEDE